MSALSSIVPLHFHTQRSDGRIAVVWYYPSNNNGFGTLLEFSPTSPPEAPAFGSPTPLDLSNPKVWFINGYQRRRPKRFSFSPPGLRSLTPFANSRDGPAVRDAERISMGKVTHPSAAPANDLLLVWTPGPAHKWRKPAFDAGIYLLRGDTAARHPSALLEVKNDPDYNEIQPRALVRYEDIYGVPEPTYLPWYYEEATSDPGLPLGSPFGLVGAPSLIKRDTKPGRGSRGYHGLDAFNRYGSSPQVNWRQQGADAGRYEDDDIFAIRILAMEPTSSVHGNMIRKAFRNHAGERLRILGEIAVRKYDSAGQPILDQEGNPDTSFLAKIPADVPFTFQTIDRHGRVLNMSQTWHQLRPGEVRTDCGGCHAHSQTPMSFDGTLADTAAWPVVDLTEATPLLTKSSDGSTETTVYDSSAVDVEYYRDIKPILERSCVQCHSKSGVAEAGLVLDDEDTVKGFEKTWNRLAGDRRARYGIPPVSGKWRYPNASRYIRKFQSRRSLLVWKIFGSRLDGWSNDDHPTELVPGDPATLPDGVSPRWVDLDYTGGIMPPPDSGVPPLTENEKMLFARWVDLGAPITKQAPRAGWFADELRPTLALRTEVQEGEPTGPHNPGWRLRLLLGPERGLAVPTR